MTTFINMTTLLELKIFYSLLSKAKKDKKTLQFEPDGWMEFKTFMYFDFFYANKSEYLIHFYFL